MPVRFLFGLGTALAAASVVVIGGTPAAAVPGDPPTSQPTSAPAESESKLQAPAPAALKPDDRRERFDEAVDAARRAIAAASARSAEDFALAIEARLALYEARKPFRRTR